ncbi:MAG: hypothetical protein V1867_00675 [Candidatus Falkowbacteria bacterium]
MKKMVITVKGFPADYPNLRKVYQRLSAAVFDKAARIDQNAVEVLLDADLVPETAGRNIFAAFEPYGKFYLGIAECGALVAKLGEQIKMMCPESYVFVKIKTDNGKEIYWDSVDGIQF